MARIQRLHSGGPRYRLLGTLEVELPERVMPETMHQARLRLAAQLTELAEQGTAALDHWAELGRADPNKGRR